MTLLHFQPFRDHRAASARHAALEALNDATRAIIAMLRSWRWRARERTQLARLDARMLQDIGMSPADRDFLVNKPFWRE